MFHILTPYPGTVLYDRLEKEGRIIERDWAKYDMTSVVIRPRKMTPEALEGGVAWAYGQIPGIKTCLEATFTGPVTGAPKG
jgi:hypothetical protein